MDTFRRQPGEMFFAVYIVCILSLQAGRGLAIPARKTCRLGKNPVDPELFHKSMEAASGCSRGGVSITHSVRIEPWAVIYTTFNSPQVDFGPPPVCREEIVSVYRRRNRVPKLYHRPAIYDRNGSKNIRSDCSKITVRKIMAWGAGRKEFTRLLKKMETGIKGIRITNCVDDYHGEKPAFTRAELNRAINRERIATAALTVINGAAFNSYLCV